MELTISSLIKMILGIFAVVFIIFGFYMVLKGSIGDLFKGFTSGTPVELILSMIY